MSYNILNKNVNFQGSTQGTVEDLVDTHSTQTVNGLKTVTFLTGTHVRVTNDATVLGNLSASVNISASAFYGDGSNLTGVDKVITALNGATSAANSKITTANGTELDAEGSLTFNSTTKELVVGSPLLGGATGSFYGKLSASQEISASSFWGDGSNLTGVDVALAANSGLNNSSGLIIDPNNATEETSAAGSHFLLIYNGSALRKITAQRVADLSSPADWCANMTDNRVITAAGTDTMNGEANLTFNGSTSRLTVTGDVSGSGFVSASIGHFVTKVEAGAIDLEDASGIAGLGLVGSFGGTLSVQTSGAVKITSDKLGITGSLAGVGLGFDGGVNSISEIKFDPGSLPDTNMAVADDYVVFLDGGATGDPKKEQFADVVTNMKGNGLTATSGILAVGAGTGIDVSTNAIAVDVSDFMISGSNNRIVTATGTDAMISEFGLQYNSSTGIFSQGGLSGGAGTHSRLVVRKTSISDNSATDVVTFTVPNANHAAAVRVMGLVNFDGCTYSQAFSFQATIARASGQPTDKGFSSVTATESGSGVTPNFSIAVGGSSNTGANSASQTFTLQMTINTSDSASSNATFIIELINFNNFGISMEAS